MGEQIRQTYVNIERVLARFGASLADIVEEAVHVLDMDAAFAVVGDIRKAAYGVPVPPVASTIVECTRLAFPEQLVEITVIARVYTASRFPAPPRR